MLILAIFFAAAIPAFAQEIVDDVDSDKLLEDLGTRFSRAQYVERYQQSEKIHYYRFPLYYSTSGWSSFTKNARKFSFSTRWLFDPVDLRYFPHENLDYYNSETTQENKFFGKDYYAFGLYGRYTDGANYFQSMTLRRPADTDTYYGYTNTDKSGYADDFYFYTDFIIDDMYPAQTGGCYLYLTNSIIDGTNSSTGLLINIGGKIQQKIASQEETSQAGENVRIYYIDGMPVYYEFKSKTNDIMDISDIRNTDPAAPSIGNNLFPSLKLDENFAKDAAAQQALDAKNGLNYPQEYYRLEIVRIDGTAHIFINGKRIVSVKDGIDKKLGWAFGPVLYKGGETVSCSTTLTALYSPK